MQMLDVAILEMIHAESTPLLDRLAVALTQMGGPFFIIIVVALISYGLIRQHQQQAALTMLLTVGGAGLINVGLKLLFQRARPSLWEVLTVETTYSFPSGHAMLSSASAFAAIILLWKSKWRLAALTVGAIYVVTVGFTRVYLGVHYPSDVIAGWIISLGWALWIHWTVRKFSYRRSKA